MIPCLPTEPNVILSIARAAAAPSPAVGTPAAAGEGTGSAREPVGSGKSPVAPGRSTVERGRIEITERDAVHGLRTCVAYFPLHVDPELADQLRPIIDEAVEALAPILGADTRLALAAEIARQAQDAEAYEREARRRGVLAL